MEDKQQELKIVKIRIRVFYWIFYWNGISALINIYMNNRDVAVFNLALVAFSIVSIFSMDSYKEELERELDTKEEQ